MTDLLQHAQSALQTARAFFAQILQSSPIQGSLPSSEEETQPYWLRMLPAPCESFPPAAGGVFDQRGVQQLLKDSWEIGESLWLRLHPRPVQPIDDAEEELPLWLQMIQNPSLRVL
jgi:hypothetical protein